MGDLSLRLEMTGKGGGLPPPTVGQSGADSPLRVAEKTLAIVLQRPSPFADRHPLLNEVEALLMERLLGPGEAK